VPPSFAPKSRALDTLTPIEVAARLRHLPGLVFFDTAGHVPSNSANPVSIIAARPRATFTGRIDRAADRARLRAALDRHAGHLRPDAGFPLGGLCGWIDYEGDFIFGDYPEMLVHDPGGNWHEVGGLSTRLADPPAEGETIRVSEPRALTSKDEFLAMVARALDWIAAGDIYQVNLARHFVAEVRGGSLFPLYEALRTASPAPMAAWLALGGREILSSSPETFLRISARGIETRPIKGTRPRFADPAEDRRSAYELQTSAKEIAELVMITDLLRNDLGQVCEFGSVGVREMLQLETLEQVHHLVSTVTGTLRPETDVLDAVAACFPGGSITGAPKRRAREIIRTLEPGPRGLYCGAIGYFGYHGESQFNIAIRSLERRGPEVRFHAGAGIVADSDPLKEYEETRHKAEGIRLALERISRRP
jgi:anthranilate/para-aminobenzoate synthase component I